ncbi:MAG TPA: hypothetical protein VKD71_04175 [Gemmataceae bacterium]|nr:hypothetical protein [Gemmataceae bacterium]
MKDLQEKEWLRVVVSLCLAVLSLVMVALVGIAGLAWFEVSRDQIPDEHKRLIADLKKGSISKLEDITPTPDYIYGPEKAANPHPEARYFLFYGLPRNRTLTICVDAQLRLIDYRFHVD